MDETSENLQNLEGLVPTLLMLLLLGALGRGNTLPAGQSTNLCWPDPPKNRVLENRKILDLG